MKTLSTIILSLLFSLCCTAMPYGEEQRFNPQEYQAKADAYITKQAELSTEEAQKFFPIFHEMKSKQWDKNKQIRKLKREKLSATSSDKEYAEVLEKIETLKVDIAELEASYTKKMCKAIPARKVYAAMLAEECFHREMLAKSRHHKEGEK